MINIKLNRDQKTKMEELYWGWFERFHLKKFKRILESDINFKVLMECSDSISDEKIKHFFLSDISNLRRMKEFCDEHSIHITNASKDFMAKRYKNFRTTQAAKIVNEMGITICPYCNQNHLNIIRDKKGKLRFYGDMDHFFCKSAYPMFSICLYNLIPSCKVCNQLKESKEDKINYPINEFSGTNIKFTTDFDETLDLSYLCGKSENFIIKIEKENLTEEEKNELELFKIEDRYKALVRNAQEIIIKAKSYDVKYRNLLKDKFGIDEETIKQRIFGYNENHLNRVLSKFNEDIMNEFLTDK